MHRQTKRKDAYGVQQEILQGTTNVKYKGAINHTGRDNMI